MTLVGGVRREEESEGILLCKSAQSHCQHGHALSQKVQLVRQEARKYFNFLSLKFNGNTTVKLVHHRNKGLCRQH